MKRDLIIEPIRGEDGELYFDRQDAERKLSFLLDALEFFGGTFAVVALREQLEGDSFETLGLRIKYDGFAPAQRKPVVVEDEEPVAA